MTGLESYLTWEVLRLVVSKLRRGLVSSVSKGVLACVRYNRCVREGLLRSLADGKGDTPTEQIRKL